MELNNEPQQQTARNSLPRRKKSDERSSKSKPVVRYVAALVISVLVLLVLSYFGSSKIQAEGPPDGLQQVYWGERVTENDRY